MMKTPSCTNRRKRLIGLCGRLLLWTVLVLGTAVALLFAIENWQGARVYVQAQQAYEEAGGTLDWNDLLPGKLYPDEENFCAIPELNGITVPDIAPNGEEASRKRQRLNPKDIYILGNANKLVRQAAASRVDGYTTNFTALRDALTECGLPIPETEPDPARAILQAIEENFPAFAAFDAAVERQEAQFLPPMSEFFSEEDPWPVATPHLSLTRSVSQWLTIRAAAALGCGESEIAHSSMAATLRLTQGLLNEPWMMMQLVGYTQLFYLQSPIWEALDQRALDEKDLERLGNELGRIDIAGSCASTISANTLYFNGLLDHLKRCGTRDMMRIITFNSSPSPQSADVKRRAKFIKLMPNGWFDRGKVENLRQSLAMQSALESEDFLGVREVIETMRSFDQESEPHWRPIRWVAGAQPVQLHLLNSAAHTDGFVQLARIAIALERFHLDHGRYPLELDALVPDYFPELPPDPMGDSWRYAPGPDSNGYKLYSIGWNLIDDGGSASGWKIRDHLDWVWVR